jgi:hypothetical protein
MINWKNGWIIKGGQKYATKNHEKSSRDQDFKIESSETLSQVGHQHNVRKREAAASDRAPRSLWFTDSTREIPPNSSWFG